MTNTAINIAKDFVRMVSENGIPVDSAYVFGSYAKGHAKTDSDIDVCIISRKFGKDYIKEMVDLRKIALKIDSKIEPIAFGVNDLNDKYSSLATEIRQSGILVPIS
ncbi:MAG: polymerase, beta-like protein region protein [Candidatus Woesebacteria bacterium GW2011_GWA2_40_7]|uniref:Polymerase, beta-like protein region protein n=3 Tax=Candidatus Woeseibacteriota TaxID=1752722 RepID=A0A0G0UTX0_9BACT|nr:MAG: polymerase, beta-like protein region protein [Candidatus Woesebacteria bacterium GW2011_GWB1_39_10]KKR73053.1 MAG: polymerase, beta-like protein region protein [Candidatus Woesebacteria bacterium GW2011_GWA2_40_7]KKR92194.1 MAG: polymerase, beta-like protein region protein [Candidatus Woesebacteria bacterium GW2011_GWA1_41_13b]